MVEREVFAEQVHDAFAHLHDLPHLRTHPLAKLLAPAGSTLPPAGLRGMLLAAVEQLRPPADAPRQSTAWRRYRYLQLRYLEGASHEAIARELFVSTRQARRDHLEALGEVAAILWEARPTSVPGTGEGAAPTASAATEDRELPADQAALDAELSKTELGEGGLRSTFGEVISGVVEIADRLARSHGGSLDLFVEGDLPPAAVDRTILRQILLSLLSYAIQVEPGARLCLAAKDDGEAIALDVTAEEVAVQASARPRSAAPSAESLSALAAAERLADLHGVSISVQRAGGKPFLRIVVPEVRPRTVLVVDDNPDVAKLFERYLRGTGFRLVQARTWQRALQLAEEARPDVITLDVMMPSLDGWDIFQRLKALPAARPIPVVVCSVLPEKPLALAMGASGFLPKPFTRRSLLAALGEALVSTHEG